MTTQATWTREEDKAFENALAAAAPPPLEGLPEDDWFVALAASVPARSTEEVRLHYEALVEDVGAIDAGRVPLPRYAGEESDGAGAAPKDDGSGHRREDRKSYESGKNCSKAEQERRKGIPWTEEEHRYTCCMSRISTNWLTMSIFRFFLVYYVSNFHELADHAKYCICHVKF
jgi:hypothetical protein